MWEAVTKFSIEADTKLKQVDKMDLLPKIKEPLLEGIFQKWQEHFEQLLKGLDSIIQELEEKEMVNKKKK
jgi:hypothetical protein